MAPPLEAPERVNQEQDVRNEEKHGDEADRHGSRDRGAERGPGADPVEERSGAQSPTQRARSTGQERVTGAPGGALVPEGTLATRRWPPAKVTCTRRAEPA